MVTVAILVVSSKILSGEQSDTGRERLEHMIQEIPAAVDSYEVVADDRKAIRERLLSMCDDRRPDIVLTVGGTGVRPTDWAPEATQDVIEKEVPGIGEAMRQESLKKVRTAMLSRGMAGIRGSTLIINLPGSPRGARENLSVVQSIVDHTVDKLSGRTSGGDNVT